MSHLQSFFSLDNAYFVQTLFAFLSLALGLLGIGLGQRVSTNGRACLVIGLGVGLLTMALLATSFGSFAPGIALVFIGSFLGSGHLTKFTSGKS